jgi:hypothetical protein
MGQLMEKPELVSRAKELNMPAITLVDRDGVYGAPTPQPQREDGFRRTFEKFLRVEGVLQNQDHTISIKASRVLASSITAAETGSHDSTSYGTYLSMVAAT